MVGKAEARARLRSARRALPPAQRQAEAAAAVAVCLRLAGRFAADALASYAALPDELDLADLHRAWWALGRTVLLPRVTAPGRLSWHRVAGEGELSPGAHGIREPDPARTPAVGLPAGGLVLVPGIGFTRQGHRLGQGGGFYDRALAEGVIAVGVGFACQLVDALPLAEHDRCLDGLVIAGRLVLAPRLP